MKRIAVLSICIMITLYACINAQNNVPKDYIPYGISDNLPVFYEQLKESLKFPMAWENSSIKNYEEWQKEARAITISCMMTPPPKTDFDLKIISRQKKDGYETQKLVLNISSYCRIPAYLLIPEGKGPFPAIILMHDHGSRFSIGKEKAPVGFKPAGSDELPRNTLEDDSVPF